MLPLMTNSADHLVGKGYVQGNCEGAGSQTILEHPARDAAMIAQCVATQ